MKIDLLRPARSGAICAVFLLAAVICGSATASEPAAAPAHAIPTNIPGVYAFSQPPSDFDPMTASAEELASWGYPARPAASAGADELAQWKAVVNPANVRVVPQLVRHPDVFHQPATNLKSQPGAAIVNAVQWTSSNWSGYALTPASGAEAFYYVAAHWIIPTVQQAPGTCSGGWDYSSQWVGIDGFNNDYLLQAGSAANVECVSGKNTTQYFPWLEWLPESELEIYKNASTDTPFPFVPGDYLYVVVWATNFSGGASTTGNLTFSDGTQHWSVALTFSAASVGGTQVTGQSAEWVVERTDVDGSFATLPDYIANAWRSAEAEDLGSVIHYPGSPGTATSNEITMTDNSGNPVSYVNIYGSNTLWFFPEGSATK